MAFLLDTNSFIAVMTRRNPGVMLHMAERRDQIRLSVIVLHELYFGAFNSERVNGNLSEIHGLGLPIVPFEDADARAAGEIRARLKRAGTPIGPFDVLIAGQAIARDLVLVTANTREFSWVEGLKLENWIAE